MAPTGDLRTERRETGSRASRCQPMVLVAAGRHFPLPVVTSRCRSSLPAAGRHFPLPLLVLAAGRDFLLPLVLVARSIATASGTHGSRKSGGAAGSREAQQELSNGSNKHRVGAIPASGGQEAQQEVRRRSKKSATAATSTASAPSRQQEVRRRSRKSGGAAGSQEAQQEVRKRSKKSGSAARSREAQRQPGRHSGNPGASAFKLDNPRAPPTANYPATGAHSGPVSPSFSSSFAKIGLGLDSGVPATIGRDSHTACSEA